MESSDEELFSATPSCSTSVTSLSLSLTDLEQDSTKEKDCNNVPIKNISVKLTRLPYAEMKKQTKNQLCKKRRGSMWKYGSYCRKKKIPEKSSTHETCKKMESAVETSESEASKDTIDEHVDTRLHKEPPNVKKESYIHVQQGAQDAQMDNESSISLTCEASDKEEDCAIETHTCARTIPYEFHLRNSISPNSIEDVVTYSDSSSLLSSNSEDTEQDLHNDEASMSEGTSSSQNKEKMTKKQFDQRLNRMAKEIAKQKKQLEEWKFKRKLITSDNESLEQLLPTKRCRQRVLSNESSDNELETASVMEVTKNSNRNESLERTNQEKSRTNMQISREVKVTLTRLEKMIDMNIVKWRESKTKNSPEIISESVKGQQLNEQKQLQDVIISRLKRESSVETEDIHEAPSKSSMVSDIHVAQCSPTKSKDSLDLTRLRKKYKLFKKPRVLVIKLETLPYSLKAGRYSATKIDWLTKKYINFVISSSSLSSSHKTLHRFAYLRRKNMTDVNSTCSIGPNAIPGPSGKQSVNKTVDTSFESMIAERSPTIDNQMENNSDENVPFKNNRKPSPVLSRNKVSSPSKRKKTLMEIWRNAFCRQTFAAIPKNTTVVQSTSANASAQSASEAIAVPRNLPKKSANVERESASGPLASTPKSSIKDNALVGSPGKLASPKKQVEASTKSTKFNETSEPELSTSNTTLPNASVEETTSKNDFSQSKTDTISKSPHKDAIKKKVIASNDSLNSSTKVSSEKISSSLPEKTSSLKPSIIDMVSVKSKISQVRNVNQPSRTEMRITHTDFVLKCVICGVSVENYELLRKHMTKSSCKMCTIVNSSSSNPSKRAEPSQLEKLIVNEIVDSRNSKPSTSQQLSSINKDNDTNKSNRSLVNKEVVSSPGSSSPKSGGTRFWTPQKGKSISFTKSLSDADLDTQRKRGIIEPRRLELPASRLPSDKRITCTVCSLVFDTFTLLKQHMLKHMKDNLQNACVLVENKVAPTRRETDESVRAGGDRVERSARVEAAIEIAKNGINEQEKRALEDANEPNAKSPVAEVSQHDVNEERNKTPSLPEAGHAIRRDADERMTLAASNADEHGTNKTCAGTKETCGATPSSELQSTKPIIICECHRPKAISNREHVQIEMALLCNSCQTLFRRFDCFEKHCQNAKAGTLCAMYLHKNRSTKLFCVGCQAMLNSIQEMWRHLMMHSRVNRKNMAHFCCNICKVIFRGKISNLFINHFHQHVANSFFVASRLAFPDNCYIGLKLVMQDNIEPIEVYMQVADYVCRQCRKVFESGHALKSHELLCQKNVADNDGNEADDDASGSSNGKNVSIVCEKIILTCGFCNKTFYNRPSFELHSLDHKQKRELHSHYTCVAVTAITKVYICKVCTTMWKSVEEFEKHWLTHGMLQEIYVCSNCKNHYNTIDQLREHAITHQNSANNKQEPLSCKVIYRDVSNQSFNTNEHNSVDGNNPSQTSLNCLNAGEAAEKNACDGPHDLLGSSTNPVPQNTKLEGLLRNKQVAGVATTILPESSIRSSEKDQQVINSVDASQIAEQISLTDIVVAQSKQARENGNANHTEDSLKINNNASKNGNVNSAKSMPSLDDSEEDEELVILVSESEESSVSSEIRKTGSRKTDDVSPVKCNDAQESAAKSDSVAVANRQDQQLSNDMAAIVTPTKISGDASKSSNSRADANVTALGESLALNVSQDNGMSVDDTNVENSTTATTTRDDCADRSVISDASFQIEKSKELLPRNVMSAVPKSFLRVKSLAELTNAPLSTPHLCQVCGLLFDHPRRLMEHLLTHRTPLMAHQSEQSSQVSSANNVQGWSSKPEFNPSMHMPAIQNQDHLPQSMATSNNAPPSGNVRPHTPARVIDTSNSRQYQVAGVKPLHTVRYDMAKKVAKPNQTAYGISWVPPLNNPNVAAQPQQMSQQRPIYHQNLPAHVACPVNRLSQPAQQQTTGTVAVRPFIQTYQTPRPGWSPSVYQHLPALYQKQHQQQQQLPPQQQQLPPQQQQLPLQQQQLPPQQQQLPPQQQQLPPQQQQLPPQQQQLPPQQQQLPPQQQQLPQQQQQQQTNISHDVLQYMLSKKNVPYQLMPVNPDNMMLLIGGTMQQVSTNPERYICIYCPDFECNSVNECLLHERSPKHEARSHYNTVAYMPRT